jgi:hypothetical protein
MQHSIAECLDQLVFHLRSPRLLIFLANANKEGRKVMTSLEAAGFAPQQTRCHRNRNALGFGLWGNMPKKKTLLGRKSSST